MGNSENQNEWFADEEFWNRWFRPELEKREQEQIDKISSLLEIEKESDILDLGCGRGRHARELAARGHNVTGVDIDEKNIKIAREKAEADEEVLQYNFIKDDMREFKKEKEFDIILSLFSSFGYFKEEKENEKVLKNAYESLRSGGKLLIDVKGKEVIAGMFEKRGWHELDDKYLLEKREIQDDWKYIHTKWTFISPQEKNINEYKSTIRLYSAAELESKLKKIGFSQIEIYGSFEGDPYNEEAERTLVIAQK